MRVIRKDVKAQRLQWAPVVPETDDKRNIARCAMLIRPTTFLQYIEFAMFLRIDKALTPHPART